MHCSLSGFLLHFIAGHRRTLPVHSATNLFTASLRKKPKRLKTQYANILQIITDIFKKTILLTFVHAVSVLRKNRWIGIPVSPTYMYPPNFRLCILHRDMLGMKVITFDTILSRKGKK